MNKLKIGGLIGDETIIITNDNIEILYDADSRASYAAGDILISIPYREVSDGLKRRYFN